MTHLTPLQEMWNGVPMQFIMGGPNEVHKVTVARNVRKSYEPHEGNWPTHFYPSLREEAKKQALAARPDDEGPVTALRNAYLVTSTTAPEDRASVAMQSRVLRLAPSLRNRAHGERTFDLGPLVVLVAHRMRVHPERDPRPETIVAAMSGVPSAAYQRWVDRGGQGNQADEIGAALSLIEVGLAMLDELEVGP